METLSLLLSFAAAFGLFLFIKHYFPTYFRDKASNLAEKEDLGELADLVKKIKFDDEAQFEKIKTDLKEESQMAIETVKAELTNQNNLEMEIIKSKLQVEFEVIKTNLMSCPQEQFNLYNELWVALCDLEICIDGLWESSSIKNLESLADQLRITREKIRKSALIIEDTHYKNLNSILSKFEGLDFGKKRLVELRKGQAKRQGLSDEKIHSLLQSNKQMREDLKNYLPQIMHFLKGQLRTN